MKNKSKKKYVVLLVVLIAILLAINIFADKILQIGIETVATKTLNVGVSLGDVDLSILGGRLGLEDLVIDNPPGYQHDKLLDLKDIRVAIDVKSLLSDEVKIKQLKLDGMDVVLEQRGVTGNNLQDIIKSIPTKEQAKKEKEQEPAKPGRNLRIDDLEISNVTVKVKLLPIPGKADTVTLKLKPIKMTDLGTKEKMDFATLSSKILLAILGGIAEQGAGLLPDDLTESMKTELTRVKDLSKTMLQESGKALEGGKDVGKDVVDKAKDIGKDIGEGLKGLFKPKEE